VSDFIIKENKETLQTVVDKLSPDANETLRVVIDALVCKKYRRVSNMFNIDFCDVKSDLGLVEIAHHIDEIGRYDISTVNGGFSNMIGFKDVAYGPETITIAFGKILEDKIMGALSMKDFPEFDRAKSNLIIN